MLKLYYTGSKEYLGIQGKKELSLGGFPSSTPIPNGQKGSIFGNISPYTRQNEMMDVIGIIIKNEGDNTITDIVFYFDLLESIISEYEIAAVSLSQDSQSRYYMEEISNAHSLPYYATFNTANGESGSVGLGSLASGGMLGLWLKRTVSNTVKTCDELWDEFKNDEEVSVKEEIGLVFNWDESADSSDSSSSS